MDFNDSKPIYRQIVDLCHERILSGQWREGERVPSVRELGLELAVNSHTALKAYDVLQAEEVIAQRRGLGFFLADDASAKVLKANRQEFFDTTLPQIFGSMERMGITIEDIDREYKSRRIANSGQRTANRGLIEKSCLRG